jgi:hypothetical protein
MLHAVNYFCGSSRFRVTRLRGIRACAPSPVAGSATYAGRNGRASRPRTPRVEGCTQRACCSPNARRAIWPAFPKAPARKQLFSFASRKCQTCPMLTSHAWNGPTFRELRAEGVLLSANEERRHWEHQQREHQQRREGIAERCWLRERPWIGPLVWAGGNFSNFLSRTDNASIRAAFSSCMHPLNAPQRRLAQTTLYVVR